MYDDDDDYVSSVPYRLMPPRKRPRSEIGQALDAAGGSVREALDAANGTAPDPAEPGGATWPDPPAARQRLRRLGRALARANWLLIATVAGTIATVAGVVIACLTLVKPG
jgi:hypothetical protein